VHTLIAAHRREIFLRNFYRENTLPLRVDAEVLYPDSVFELHTQDGRQFNFVVELDNGTERIRSEKDTDSWQSKIRRYNILQDRNYPKRFRVLVVCTRSSGRLQSILDLAARHTTNPQRALIYGTHLDEYLKQPDALCHPCFRTHHGEPIALVPDLPAPSSSSRLPSASVAAEPHWMDAQERRTIMAMRGAHMAPTQPTTE
jgi:hypothetical protein